MHAKHLHAKHAIDRYIISAQSELRQFSSRFTTEVARQHSNGTGTANPLYMCELHVDMGRPSYLLVFMNAVCSCTF